MKAMKETVVNDNLAKYPLVSIITVCLNNEKYIEQTIKSVLEQTFKNIEYVIIDGGSKDKTVDIIKNYEDKISFWISEPDNGIYDGMNKGIRFSKGQIIGIINSGDWYEIDAVEEVIHFFKQKVGACIVHGNRKLWDEEGSKLKGTILPSKNYSKLIYHTLPISHSTCFVKRSIYSRYGLFDIRYKFSADHEFFLRLYKEDIYPYYLNKLIANVRAGGGSYTLGAIKESQQISKKYKSALLGRIIYFSSKKLLHFLAKNLNFPFLRWIYCKINSRYA
jgi:glycosyltransferase involved in cell wall biosynthesis